MKKLLTLLFTLLTVLPTLSHAQSEGQVPDAVEYAALKAIYEATGGDNWTKNDNWLQGTTSSDFATWYGVAVSNGDVYSLNLYSNNLLGDLPSELGELINLKGLYLYNNQLTSLPSELEGLTNLISLRLNNNQLINVPSELGELTNLTNLDLAGNQLSNIPPELGELTNLTVLNLSGNKLNSIPSELGKLNNLEKLYLGSNQFSSLPSEIGKLINLTFLDLAGNQLSSLPSELGELINLTFLDLIGNQLSSLPSELGELTNLTDLVLSYNQLTSIPNFSDYPSGVLEWRVDVNKIDLNYIAQNLTGPETHIFKTFEYGYQASPSDTLPIVGTFLLDPFPLKHPQSNFQWQRRIDGTWQDIEGATEATYLVDDASATLYRCRLTNNWLPNMSQYSAILKVMSPPSVSITQVWLEAECADQVGEAWQVVSDSEASGGSYLQVQPGNSSIGAAPTDASKQLTFTFSVSQAGEYTLYSRQRENGSHNDDSFWVRTNAGSWVKNGLNTPAGSFDWGAARDADNNFSQVTFSLVAGSNTLTLGTREDNLQLDKLYLTLDGQVPSGRGGTGSNCNPPTSPENGVNYAYYKDQTENWSALPDFASLSPQKEGILDNFSLSPAEQADFYGFVYTTYLEVDQAGEYTFYLLSDDGSQLLVEGEQVVSYDGRHSATEEQSGKIMLSKGRHKLEVRYFEYRFSQSLLVSYQGPGVSKQAIPDEVLFLEDDDNTPEPPVASASVWLEAECALAGSKWKTVEDAEAAGGKYLVYPVSGRSLESVPTNLNDHVVFSVDVTNAGSYYLQALIRAPSKSRDSFWFKIDNGEWIKWWQGISTGETFTWNLAPGGPVDLTAGSHTITFAYREGSTQLDKIALNSSSDLLSGLGEVISCPIDEPAVLVSQEAECAQIGANWTLPENVAGSDVKYAVYPSGKSFDVPPSAVADHLVFDIEVTQSRSYYLWARANAPSLSSNSFWVRVDDQPWFEWWEGITTGQGFNWNMLPSGPFDLAVGTHTITVAYREGGTQLDKLLLSTSTSPPISSSATTTSCDEPDNYTPPAPPSIVNNPPDATTAPSVSGTLTPTSQSSSDVNYVRVYTPREMFDDPDKVTMSTPVPDVTVNTEYLDGLGRPIQTVVRGGSNSTGQDLVQPMAYDAYGRQVKQYLPYAASEGSGSFRANAIANQYAFYTDGPSNVVQSDYPYTQMEYEASPLNRVVKQAAPGKNWRLGSGHEVETQYLVNTGSEVQHWTASNSLSSTALSAFGNYGAGELYKTVTMDENNHSVTEYTDKEGQTVLKRVQGPDGDQDTYYVYDDFNLLRFVLPPEASKQLKSNSGLANNADFKQQHLFLYTYDARRRMSSKQVPGGGTTKIQYDQWNRLVSSQNAQQAANGEWSFTKYDNLNRPIMTGVSKNLQAASGRYEEASSSTIGYSLDQSYPKVDASEVRTVTYYDDYDFPHAGSYSAPANTRSNVQGQVTGTLTRNLSDNSWLESITYYDEQQRPLVSISENHLGGQDRLTTTYRNAVNSEVLKTVRVHSTSSTTHTITEQFTYDHQGRLLSASHQLDSEPVITLSAQQYNAIGELVNKELGNSQQSIAYRYNIRGWLTKINDLENEQSYFNQELYYDYGFTKKQHNGNIAGVQWNRAGGKAHAYGYLYDEVNRITGADYRSKEANAWSATPGNFSVDQVKYDQNGNIAKLKRYGELEERQYLLDDMTYTYQGNRLQAVQDAGEAQFGFVDGATSATEYDYDLSGNLISDKNKGISEIKYDAVLNLPEEVVITEKGTISYSYDAQGMKLRQEVVPSDGGEKKTTDYVQGFHYEDGKLSFIQHAEGRLMMDTKAYHYDLKDHLGNSRVTFSSKPVTTTAMASMEMSAAPEEEAVFEGVAESRQTLAFHNTTDPSIAEPEPQQVATLMPGEQGPSKSLQVYQGDTVRLKVNARYETTPQQVQGLEGVATEVVGAVQKTASGLESSGVSEGVSAIGATGALANEQQEAPQAYLNYLVYDEDYQLVNQGFVAVSEAAAVGKSNPEAAPEELALEVPIQEDGFVYAYLSNGVANNSTPVHFDDFTVEQQSYIVAVYDYYPFGLTHSQPLDDPINRYLYNGKELQNSFKLGLYDYGARFYDPAIGQFTTVDPLADQMSRFSPYSYAFDNPIRFIDPDGMAPEDCCGDLIDDIELPDISLEITVTAGAQAGIKIGNIVEADVTVANVEIVKDETSLKDGNLSSTKKLGTLKATPENGVESDKAQVENSIGLQVMGVGGKIGQKQNVDGDLQSSDYVTFTESGAGVGSIASSIIEETDSKGNTRTKQESSFTIGAKFLLGVELKFKLEQ